jgi:hypothetical protein
MTEYFVNLKSGNDCNENIPVMFAQADLLQKGLRVPLAGQTTAGVSHQAFAVTAVHCYHLHLIKFVVVLLLVLLYSKSQFPAHFYFLRCQSWNTYGQYILFIVNVWCSSSTVFTVLSLCGFKTSQSNITECTRKKKMPNLSNCSIYCQLDVM